MENLHNTAQLKVATVRVERAEKNPSVNMLQIAEKTLLQIRAMVKDNPEEKAIWSSLCYRLGVVRNNLEEKKQ